MARGRKPGPKSKGKSVGGNENNTKTNQKVIHHILSKNDKQSPQIAQKRAEINDPTVTEAPSKKVAPRSGLQFKVGPQFMKPEVFKKVFITSSGVEVYPQLMARIDRGFDNIDGKWIGYKRNYFTLCSAFKMFGQSPGIVFKEKFHFFEGGNQVNIKCFAIKLDCRQCESTAEIKLIQHTSKRDKGPIFEPSIFPSIPGDLPDHELIKEAANVKNKKKLSSINKVFYLSDDELKQASPDSILSTYPACDINRAARYERMQVSTPAGTRSAGGFNDSYILKISLLAVYDDGKSALITSTSTPTVVVRGRSPSNYPLRGGMIYSNASAGKGIKEKKKVNKKIDKKTGKKTGKNTGKNTGKKTDKKVKEKVKEKVDKKVKGKREPKKVNTKKSLLDLVEKELSKHDPKGIRGTKDRKAASKATSKTTSKTTSTTGSKIGSSNASENVSPKVPFRSIIGEVDSNFKIVPKGSSESIKPIIFEDYPSKDQTRRGLGLPNEKYLRVSPQHLLHNNYEDPTLEGFKPQSFESNIRINMGSGSIGSNYIDSSYLGSSYIGSSHIGGPTGPIGGQVRTGSIRSMGSSHIPGNMPYLSNISNHLGYDTGIPQFGELNSFDSGSKSKHKHKRKHSHKSRKIHKHRKHKHKSHKHHHEKRMPIIPPLSRKTGSSADLRSEGRLSSGANSSALEPIQNIGPIVQMIPIAAKLNQYEEKEQPGESLDKSPHQQQDPNTTY